MATVLLILLSYLLFIRAEAEPVLAAANEHPIFSPNSLDIEVLQCIVGKDDSFHWLCFLECVSCHFSQL